MSLSPFEEERYARHFSLREVGRPGQEKLKNAKVLIIGTGGLGSPIALYLAAAGVGRIGLVDGDKVSLSNLQRQILFTTAQVGQDKARSAQDKLAALNPEIQTDVYNFNVTSINARELIRHYDLVIDGSDNFTTRYCVNDACVLENKPLIFGALYKFEAQISVLHFGGGPCYRCLYPHPPKAEAIPNCSETGVLGVLPGTAGTLMATEALKLILELGQSLSGQLLIYDALDMSFFRRAFTRNLNCAVCGEHPTITSLENTAPVASEGLEWSALTALLANNDGTVVIDVRTPEEFSAESLPGSRNIPLAGLSAEFEKNIEAFRQSENLIFVCRSGQRSARAVELALAADLKNVHHLRGGLLGRKSDHLLSRSP